MNINDIINIEISAYCTEWCAECNNEVIIPTKKISKCPNCESFIKPCASCPEPYYLCGIIGYKYCVLFNNKKKRVSNKQLKERIMEAVL